MTKNIKSSLTLLGVLSALLFLCMLLLCGCGDKAPAAGKNVYPTDGDAYATESDAYATWGDAYATWGDAYATWGDAYATLGNAFYASDRLDEFDQYDYEQNFATDGDAQPENTVKVSSVDGLLDALSSNTEIVLAPGVYDLGSVKPIARPGCYWMPTYDGGFSLNVFNLYNTVIRSETGNPADVTITTPTASADVFTFDSCSRIHLDGITFGHDTNSACDGSVIHMKNYCYGVYIGRCDLYGSGSRAFYSEGGSSFTIADSKLHDCSFSAVQLFDTNFFRITDSELVNCGSWCVFDFSNCTWANIRNCAVRNCEMSLLISASNSGAVSFECCEISNSRFEGLCTSVNSGVEFKSCAFPFSSYDEVYHSEYYSDSAIRMNGEDVAFG